MSEDIPLSIRKARRDDATGIACIFVDSWRETYAGILPDAALTALSKQRESLVWRDIIARQSGRSPVLVAADAKERLYGFASLGPSRERSLPYEAEVYTLYVAPGHTGQGIGRALLRDSFALFRRAGFRSTIIWALASNPSRFFYEAQGGTLAAERVIRIFGGEQREVGYAWRDPAPALGRHP
jgi:L-amino acid N-acyltransferase YncA